MEGLTEYVLASRNQEFDWSGMNCLAFVSGALETQGLDPLPSAWTKGYATAQQAAFRYRRELQRAGFETIIQAMDARYTRALTLSPRDGSIIARMDLGSVMGCLFGIALRGQIVFTSEKGLVSDLQRVADIVWEVK